MQILFIYLLSHNGRIFTVTENWIGEPSAKELHGPFGRLLTGHLIVFRVVPVNVQRDSCLTC